MNLKPRYFPLEKGIYEVAPGLRSLGTEHVFQLDQEFPKYRANKLACRSERLGKYVAFHKPTLEVESRVNRFLVDRFCQESPDLFEQVRDGDKTLLRCRLTHETLVFNSRNELVGCDSKADPPYQNAFDALCSQVQEDVAVMSRNERGEDWLSQIHLCSPSHWAAEDKIGKNFFDIHAPVAGIEKLNRAASQFVDAMVQKGPYVRFVWGFGTDDRLNHHPEPAPGWEHEQWKGRAFRLSATGSPFFLRVERQVTFGLPDVQAAIFTIRVSFIDGNEIRENRRERDLLCAALRSMTPESQVYKGVASSMDQLLSWLIS